MNNVDQIKETRFITKSPTRTKLVERYPAGSEVTMQEIEDAYVELSFSKKGETVLRGRGRHVYLRLVDAGYWRGDTKPYIRICHGKESNCVFEWAKLGSIHTGRGIRRVTGKTLRYETVSGKVQAIGIAKVQNLAKVVKEADNFKKAYGVV